jgi:hypothetical protein
MLSAAVLALTLVATSAPAEMTFVATLNGLNNVPPRPEITATGSATLVLNDEQTELSYRIEYNGITSPETASHIHRGGPRENGGIAYELPFGSLKIGVWTNIPPEDLTRLLDGKLYINIHTVNYFQGEIRGNIVEESVATEPATWGAIKALYRN